MRFDYTFEHKGDGSSPIRHCVNPNERDATLCEEHIYPCNPNDEDWARCEGFHSITGRPDITFCGVCDSMAYNAVKDAARRQVAQELGVDESEVL